MGKIEESIYENYRQAISNGDFLQAKKAAQLGQIFKTFANEYSFFDFNSYKVPTSQIIGRYFNPFPYTYDPASGTIELETSVITLTEAENKLFYLFSLNETKGKKIKIISKNAIYSHMWGEIKPKKGALRIAIHRLRKKIEPDPLHPQIIISLPPRGYIFLGNKINE